MKFLFLLALFVGMPVIELYLLIQVGQRVGVLDTVLVVLLTGVAGAWVARSQGRQVFDEIQRRARSGEVPAEELFDAVSIFVGGLLMLTPGFVTDFLGFTMILPGVRRFYTNALRGFIAQKIRAGSIHVQTNGDFHHQGTWEPFGTEGFRSAGFEEGPRRERPVQEAKVIDLNSRRSSSEE